MSFRVNFVSVMKKPANCLMKKHRNEKFQLSEDKANELVQAPSVRKIVQMDGIAQSTYENEIYRKKWYEKNIVHFHIQMKCKRKE